MNYKAGEKSGEMPEVQEEEEAPPVSAIQLAIEDHFGPFFVCFSNGK